MEPPYLPVLLMNDKIKVSGIIPLYKKAGNTFLHIANSIINL